MLVYVSMKYVISSPGPKGQMSFSQHFASGVPRRRRPASVVVVVRRPRRPLLAFTKIFSSETTEPN